MGSATRSTNVNANRMSDMCVKNISSMCSTSVIRPTAIAYIHLGSRSVNIVLRSVAPISPAKIVPSVHASRV